MRRAANKHTRFANMGGQVVKRNRQRQIALEVGTRAAIVLYRVCGKPILLNQKPADAFKRQQPKLPPLRPLPTKTQQGSITKP